MKATGLFAVCILAIILATVQADASPSAIAKWEDFKSKHGKQYAVDEDTKRMQMFLERDADIEAHNARYAEGKESYSRRHSQYSDLTPEEFRKHATGFVPAVDPSEIPCADPTGNLQRA